MQPLEHLDDARGAISVTDSDDRAKPRDASRPNGEGLAPERVSG
jgi:hypothetical protein